MRQMRLCYADGVVDLAVDRPRGALAAVEMDPRLQYRVVRLTDDDEAFRAIVCFLVRDPAYASTRLQVVNSLFQSVRTGQYLLMCQGNEVVGCATWSQISRSSLEECLRDNREPVLREIVFPGEVFVASSVSARTPELLHRVTRALAHACSGKDILTIRHSRGGKPFFRMRVIRRGRALDPAARTRA